MAYIPPLERRKQGIETEYNTGGYIPPLMKSGRADEYKRQQEAEQQRVDTFKGSMMNSQQALSTLPSPFPSAQERIAADLQREAETKQAVQNMTAIEALQSKPQPMFHTEPMPEPLSMNLADNTKTGGYLTNRAISGLTGVTEGLEATQNLLRGQDKSGLPPTELQLQQQRLKEQRLADRLATAEAGESMPKAARFVGDMTEAGTGMLPTIALSAASGGVMGIPFIMTTATGNNYEQARREGADHEQALKYGLASGIIEGAIEGIIGGIPGMKGVADPLIDAATKSVKSRLMKEVAKYGMNALGEGVEEALSASIDPLLRRGTFDETAKADLGEILNSFLVGTATSALMQAPSSMANIRGTKPPKVSDINLEAENPVQKAVQNIQQEIQTEANNLSQPAIYGEPIQQTQQRLFVGDTQQEVQPIFRAEQEMIPTEENNYVPQYKTYDEYQKAIDDYTDQLIEKYGEEEALFAPIGDEQTPPEFKGLNTSTWKPSKIDPGELKALQNLYKGRDAIHDAERAKNISNVVDNLKFDNKYDDWVVDKRAVEKALADLQRENEFSTMFDYNDTIDMRRELYNRLIQSTGAPPELWGEYDYASKLAEGDEMSSPFGKSLKPLFRQIDSIIDTLSNPQPAAKQETPLIGEPQQQPAPIGGDTRQDVQPVLYTGDIQQEAQPMLYTGDTQQETATRPIGEPEIPDGTRERGVSANIRTDANSPEGMRASYEQDPLSYTQKANVETRSKAEAIMAEGYETARAKLDEMLDRMDTEAAPLAVMLAREAWTRGDKQGSRQIIAHAAEKATQAGQFGQAFRILRDSDPASLLTSMQNQIKKLNKDGRKQYGKKWTDVELTDEEISLIMNTPLETEAELKELQKIIGQRIANELPSTGIEKFDAWRRIAMLFNPKTHIRNVGGNVLMSGMQRTSDIVAAGLEKFIPQDQRTKAVFWKNNKDLVQKVNETWESEKDTVENISRYEINNLRALGFDKRIFQSDFLQGLNNLTMKGLNLGDIPFVQAAYKNSLGQFMKARGLTEVTQEAKDYAKRRALEATFKETNKLATVINSMKRWPVAGKLIEGAIPFSKTPANIAMRAVEYSPGGILKSLYDVKAGKGAAKAIEDLSKGLTGTALAWLGSQLFKMGWIRVDRERSSKAEGLLQEAGEQPFSIITPLGSYTFDWAQPFAVPLAMGVAFAETLSKKKDGETLLQALGDAFAAGGDTIFNMTMLRNIKDLFGSGGSVTKKWMEIPISYIEQAIPAMFGQAARIVDPVRRSTYDPDPAKEEWNRIKSRIPFASKSLEPYLNIWGEEQQQGGIAEQLFSPGYWKDNNTDDVTQEVARLYSSFKDNDMLPKVAPAKFSADKVDYVLSAEQRTQFQQDMGQENYNDIARLISSSEYQRMTDEQKVKRIKKIVNNNYEDAKKDIIEESALKGN